MLMQRWSRAGFFESRVYFLFVYDFYISKSMLVIGIKSEEYMTEVIKWFRDITPL